MVPPHRLVTRLVALLVTSSPPLISLVAIGCGPHDAGGPATGNWQGDDPARSPSGGADGGLENPAESGLPTPEGCDGGRRGWSAMRPAPLPPRHVLERATLVWTGTAAVLVGHALDPIAGGRREVYAAYRVATDTWTLLPAPPWGSAWRAPQAVAGDGRIFVWSGARGDGAIYEPATSTWRAIPALPDDARRGGRVDAQLVWSTTTGELLVWGGLSDRGEARADGAAYQPSRGTWRRIADAPIRARASPVVWTGASMALLGGGDPSCGACAPLADGASYDPARDAWSAIERPPSFEPRKTEVALPVVSNEGSTRALFFGGVVARRESRVDGLLLDPATGGADYVPAPQASVLAPSLTRTGYAAWVGGGRFWFWGGVGARQRGGSEEPLADGASFDLATRTWAPIPEGGPGPRAHAAAVWTGCEAIVFGGRRGGARLHEGALLRP